MEKVHSMQAPMINIKRIQGKDDAEKKPLQWTWRRLSFYKFNKPNHMNKKLDSMNLPRSVIEKTKECNMPIGQCSSLNIAHSYEK
mgnify:CR=1 FL=1